MQFKKWFFENDESGATNLKFVEPEAFEFLKNFSTSEDLANVGQMAISPGSEVELDGKTLGKLILSVIDKLEKDDKSLTIDEKKSFGFKKASLKDLAIDLRKLKYFQDQIYKFRVGDRTNAEPKVSFYDPEMKLDLDPGMLSNPKFKTKNAEELDPLINKYFHEFVPMYLDILSLPADKKVGIGKYVLTGADIKQLIREMELKYRTLSRSIFDPKAVRGEGKFYTLLKIHNQYLTPLKKFLNDSANDENKFVLDTLSPSSRRDVAFESHNLGTP